MAALVYHGLPELNWAGFYFARDRELVLGPFQGKPACVRIPWGSGVCGTAAARGASVVVPDVRRHFPAISPATRRRARNSWCRCSSPAGWSASSISTARAPAASTRQDRAGVERLAAILLGASPRLALRLCRRAGSRYLVCIAPALRQASCW